MLGFGWLTLRQAQEALRTGRLDDARKLLSHPQAEGRRGLSTLLTRLGHAYVERAERRLRLDDVEGAWRDLLQAEEILQGDPGAETLRLALTRLGLAEVRAALEAGDPARARDAGLRLRQRLGRGTELDALEALFRAWLTARELAEQGEFKAALSEIDRVHDRNDPPLERLDRERTEWEQNEPLLADSLQRLYAASDALRWREVIEITEQILGLAPLHDEARRLRAQAWKKVEPETLAGPELQATRPEPIPPEVSPRFLLWVDSVGGFLICLGQQLTLGQCLEDNLVEIPLVADVSRMHACLSRDTEGWMLEALRPVRVNNQETTRTLLKDNDRVTLGHSCQFVFSQPVGLSTTARLSLISGHPFPLALDGVLLMGETVLIGPGPQAHVVVPEMNRNVVLFRHRDGLGVRAEGRPLTVNGQAGQTRAILGECGQVEGDDLCFALEPVGARLA
jgi:hypothetical protein